MKWLGLIIVLAGFFNLPAQKDSSRFEIGTASYYAKKFEGRKCSSGDIFRNDSLTAAHKTLKFGTFVKVTNLKNDSVVIVRINDRLPKTSRRRIDLTRAAAKKLNFIAQGLTKVNIEVLEPKQELAP
jgi:rare lipoprotein A